MISKKLNKIGILNLISDTFTYGLVSGIQKILSLALIYLISKELTVEEFGIFDFYLIFSNLIVIVEKGSNASIIDEGHGVPDSNNSNSVQSNVIEIYLDEGSKFDYHDIQAYDYATSYFANKRAVCKKDSLI